MGAQFVVKSRFSSSQGQFEVGQVVTESELADWPTDTTNNRLLNGDLELVRSADLSESAEDEDSPTGASGESENSGNGKKGQDDGTEKAPPAADLTSMNNRALLAYAKDTYNKELASNLSRTALLAEIAKLSAPQ